MHTVCILKMLPVPASHNAPKALGQMAIFIALSYRNVFCHHLACLWVITFLYLRIPVH